ncbi:lytic transglycosylase domain-containing protein [Pseudomonas edaphica]|uniref:Lytic transglycosylase domain-containing protein n=1 Tax=Pseudomonas edaphica TaxID=2006980 RepID=A0ABY2U5K3_9PSED|nr:lytic transglycosylase domain-containing protein [Pseudomonas edaphica]
MGTSVRLSQLVMCMLVSGWTLAVKALPPAYQTAAHVVGVPAEVLYAIALQESGISLRGTTVPWPWTLNIAGAPHYYPTRAQACIALQSSLQNTAPTRIDAGLAQLNLGYQQHHYQRPCDLLDPYRNLAIAASILRDQYRPGESWLAAAGRYHRPAGGEIAERYRARVSRHLAKLTDETSERSAAR